MTTIICYEAIANDSNECIQGFFYASNLDGAEQQCRDHAKERYGKVCDSVVVAYANQFNDSTDSHA
jgi:hypothetical protein